MSAPYFHSDRLEPPSHPSERYYLFWMGIAEYDRYERLQVCRIPTRALQYADYAFVRCSDDADPYMEFSVFKNRSGRMFDGTQEFRWLLSQYPSMQFFGMTGDYRSGVIRVSSDRDLLLIKMMHGVDRCENRFLDVSR